MPLFKIIRTISKPIILTAEKLFNPPPIIRDPTEQQRIDRETASMAIYEYRACPFCMKTRRALRRLNLHIELRDALHDTQHKNDLLQQGGKSQVPCLRITSENHEDRWMYESASIIHFLENQYGEEA